MSWSRPPVAAALADMIDAATAGTVYVHRRPPETLNPMAVVIGRTTREMYATASFGVDEVDLPVLVVGGIETEDLIDTTKDIVRQAVIGDPTLKGTVQTAWPAEARGWRNMTGGGGIQLLYVELVVTIQM
jgi:hypothetical protein